MKKTIKFILLAISIFTVSLLLPNLSYATRTVYNEETLNNEISAADPGETIILQNDITVTKPIVVAKELIINGNGHNVVGSNDWTSTSGNQSMFTAQLSDAKLTLKNINLKNGPKYGVQSYDGATVILDNVSISGFNYGGVLVNGGNLEILKLHLGKNGTPENNGIEIDKGSAATNNPKLTMNGVLTTESNVNVVRAAENGYLTEFTVINSQDTTNKVVLSGNKIVLTDSDNNVISETSIPAKATPNVDVQKLIVSIIANDKTYKITVDSGETLTADLLKSHITLEENQQIDGFYKEAEYTTEFNFAEALTTDTTIYTKISTIEETQPEPEPEPEIETEPEQEIETEPEQEITKPTETKDETPKTGIKNYLTVSILTVLFSAISLIIIKKKNIKG